MDVGYKLKIIRLQNNLKQQHIADVLAILTIWLILW